MTNDHSSGTSNKGLPISSVIVAFKKRTNSQFYLEGSFVVVGEMKQSSSQLEVLL